MSAVTSKRFSRPFDQSDRRVSMINLHLCRMLESEIRDLNAKEAAAKRSLSQQIFEARTELMKKRMEKLAYEKEKKDSWERTLNRESSSMTLRARPVTAAAIIRPVRTPTVNKTLKSWAGMTYITRRKLDNVQIRSFSAHPGNDETAKIMREKLRRSPDVYLRQITRKHSWRKTTDEQQPSRQPARRHSAQPTLRPASAWDRRKIHYHVKFNENDEVIQSAPVLRRGVTAPALTIEERRQSGQFNAFPNSRRNSSNLSFMREYLGLTNKHRLSCTSISTISEYEQSRATSSRSTVNLNTYTK